MMRLRILALSAVMLLFSACGALQEERADPPKVIVGGTLIDGSGRPPVPNSIVIVELGKIVVATAAEGIKIPENAQKTNATGLFVTPSQMGARLEYGAPADLYLIQGNPLENPLLLGNPLRVMKTGEWLNAGR
jgi:imidazolonepropionase-like amidohydrolase